MSYEAVTRELVVLVLFALKRTLQASTEAVVAISGYATCGAAFFSESFFSFITTRNALISPIELTRHYVVQARTFFSPTITMDSRGFTSFSFSLSPFPSETGVRTLRCRCTGVTVPARLLSSSVFCFTQYRFPLLSRSPGHTPGSRLELPTRS